MTSKEKNTVKKIMETVNALPPAEQEKILWLGKGMVLAREARANEKIKRNEVKA